MPELRSFSYAPADGIVRRFRELFWRDMTKAADLIPLIDIDEPWTNFYQPPPPEAPERKGKPGHATPDAGPSLTPFLDLCCLLFSADYCDKPATRDELLNGNIVGAFDVRPLVEIARGVATLESLKKAMAVEPA